MASAAALAFAEQDEAAESRRAAEKAAARDDTAHRLRPVQRQGDSDEAVMHPLAAKMIDHTALLGGLVSGSRNFR